MTDNESAAPGDAPLVSPPVAPLVSIVMLAFNQRDMVGEAMASLLAQDYPNFELIVSDDGSADGTFEELQRIAAAYTGPHRVHANRTAVNRGTLGHLYEAVALSSGRFVVVAGGDDISLPHRVSALYAAWAESGADALFSTCTVIDDAGDKVMDGMIYPDPTFQTYFPARPALKIYGAMAAYDRRVFASVALPDEPIFCEDMFLSLMIHYARGTILALHDRLILYRSHEASFTNSDGSSISAEKAELKAQRLARDHVTILNRFRTMVEVNRRRGIEDDVDLSAVRRMEDFYDYSVRWTDLGIARRVRRVAGFRSRLHWRWAVPRLFGLPAFVRLKALQRAVRGR